MKISFESFKEQSSKIVNESLFTLIAGIRGAGKSTVLGTLGVHTLVIASILESHAVNSAKLYGGENVTGVLYDLDTTTNKQLKADKAFENFNAILDFLIASDDILNNYQAICVDSVSALDKTLLETSRILQEKNGFEQMKIIEQEHLRIIKKLKELHRKGLHIVVTMPILASFDDDGFYVTAKPEIRGITTTSNIAGNFDDILVVNKINNEYIFQMDLIIKKVGKEVSGNEKQLVFHPRISGLSKEDLVSVAGESLLLPADLSYIFKLKKAKLGVK